MRANEVPEAMRAMGEDYQYYPIFKTTQYYTRANTRRFGKKGLPYLLHRARSL